MQETPSTGASPSGQRWRGAIAHELNNVLGVIRGNTELVLGATGDPVLVQTCAEDILQACETLTQLSWCLQATGQRILFRPAPTVLQDWLDTLHASARRMDVLPLHLEPRSDTPELAILDGGQLQTALLHIISDGRTAGATQAWLHLGRSDDHLELRFEDDRRHRPGAVGPRGELTLAAFAAVVEATGGQPPQALWSAGRWSVHTQFPLAPTARPVPVPRSLPIRPRVLIVDDEPAVGRMVSRVLDRAGSTVEVFTDPLDALARIREGPDDFDVALFDIMMPGLTGPELLAAMRRFGIELPVVFMTGAAPADTEVFDARSVLSKPFTHHELLEALDRAHGS